MKTLLYLSSIAWVFSSSNVKPETNQRLAIQKSSPEIQQPKESRRFRFREKSHSPILTGPITTYDQVQETLRNQSPLSQTQFLKSPLAANDQKKINLFMNKVQFDRQGVSLFLNQTFNNKEYSLEFLPYSFTHLAQFIDFSHTSKQAPSFIEGAFRLFHQKLKGAPFVTSGTLERFLDQTEQPLILDLAQQEISLWKSFKKTLSLTFREKFSLVQQDPLGFFEFVSKDLAHQVTINITNPERVRTTFLRFLQQATDKIIWTSSDQENSWYSFKKLGSHFYILHTQKVIPDELDANDLYWSLIERYCYFLRLAGTRLSLETCALIKEDLLKNEYPWLNHKEQESCLTTKRERLTTALLETEAKIHAQKQGVITDLLAYQKHKTL